jgi:phage baseplate assembly protein V
VDPRLWNAYDADAKAHFRAHNIIGRAVIHMVDDSQVAQLYQFEGFAGEIHSHMQRIGAFGFGAVPLPGANLVTSHQGGHRGFNTALGVEDGRYRPTGHNPGESYQYMVDGANASTGLGGTMRKVLEGLAGWVAKLSGKTVTIGDNVNTMTLTMTSAGSLNIAGVTGDVVVNGISLLNHVHTNSGGSGNGGPPAAGT